MHVCVVRGFTTLVWRAHSRDGQRETDMLLRALVEAEIDGVAVANQLNGLKETIDSFAKVKLCPPLVRRMRDWYRTENSLIRFHSIIVLGQADIELACGVTGTATGVVVREDRGVWPHESEPSRAAERVAWKRGKEVEETQMSQCSCSLLSVLCFAVSLLLQRESLMWLEQKDALKKRMADSEAENIVRNYHLVTCIAHSLSSATWH